MISARPWACTVTVLPAPLAPRPAPVMPPAELIRTETRLLAVSPTMLKPFQLSSLPGVPPARRTLPLASRPDSSRTCWSA